MAVDRAGGAVDESFSFFLDACFDDVDCPFDVHSGGVLRVSCCVAESGDGG